SGEEAYTIAIVLAEMIGLVQFRLRVKIYATDVDEEALAEARRATYTARDLEHLPQSLRDKYFERMAERYIVTPELRRSVIFGRHDLTQDAPISRLDLLICRNTLMYFNSETQGRILARFHFALSPPGVLFLGKAEMLLSHTNLFSPVNLQYRIFSRISNVSLRDRLLVIAQTGDSEPGSSMALQVYLKEAAFDAAPVAQIVVDADGKLLVVNQLAVTVFNLNRQDLGRPLQDLEISYRPLELRSLIEQVHNTGQPLLVEDVIRTLPDGDYQYFDVQLTPMRDQSNNLMGISITFNDITRYHRLQSQIQCSNQELETANEELQSSNEELETTNEELQSTNEELETTNEELQSTNEELETMNEELQSANTEQQTINAELQLRTNELNNANAHLRAVLVSVKSGVVVVDQQFCILTWNPAASEFWGLNADEAIGKSFLALQIGLPVDQLREPIHDCFSGEDQIEKSLDAVNQQGQSFTCRVTCTPLIGYDQQRLGVILLMEATA
ncbi:MAG: CheR family methyltransferase, partial [Cyanobacteria bacterium J06627_15]